jgi:chromosome segregation ATPase
MKNAIEAAENRIDKMEGADESVFGDEDTFLTANSQLTRVKDALDKVSSLIEANKPASGYDAHDLLEAEDIELLQGNLSIVGAELQRAQMHLSEWTAIGDMRVKEVNASLAEAQAYGNEIQARLAYASAYQQASAARGQEGQSRMAQANTTLSVAQQELARANAAIAEINILMSSYRLELEGVAPYLQAATGYISQAQGYVAEANVRMQREEQKYKWYQAQQAKLQVDYDKGIQIMRGG